jgi:DNA-binding protein HU-beta
MSITKDIRGYADTAIEQGKLIVGQASAQFNNLSGTARSNVSELTNRASGAVNDVRSQAEKTLNIDAVRTAVEPYLAQAKQYRASVTDRAEGLFDSVKSDKRVAKVVSTAETLTGSVVDTVTERVVKPVASLTGRKPAAKPAARASKPASTRPAAKSTAASKATATKKAAAKKAPARKTATNPTA